MTNIEKLVHLKEDFEALPGYKGRAADVKRVKNAINYLSKFNTDGENISDLIVKEYENLYQQAIQMEEYDEK